MECCLKWTQTRRSGAHAMKARNIQWGNQKCEAALGTQVQETEPRSKLWAQVTAGESCNFESWWDDPVREGETFRVRTSLLVVEQRLQRIDQKSRHQPKVGPASQTSSRFECPQRANASQMVQIETQVWWYVLPRHGFPSSELEAYLVGGNWCCACISQAFMPPTRVFPATSSRIWWSWAQLLQNTFSNLPRPSFHFSIC